MTQTPAAKLRAAAETLRALAVAASTDETGRPTARWAVRYQPGILPGTPPRTDRSCYLDAIDEAAPDGRGARPLLHGAGGTRGRAPSVAPQHGRYIAAMHPGVGLALADWLEQAAKRHDANVTAAASVWRRAEEADERDAFVAQQTDQHALAVAREVLGTTDTESAANRRCVCGDPIEWWEDDIDPGWIHSPGADTRCLDARPATGEQPEPPLSPYYSHECGFHWHGRDGMDIPMRDGQPICPRCELATRVEQPAVAPAVPFAGGDLPDRLCAVLTARFTALGNPHSEMRYHEQGPDGWPASWAVGPKRVAEVLRELLATGEQPAVAQPEPTVAEGCWCGHPKDRHFSTSAMTLPDGCHDCRGWDGAHAYGQELPWAADGDAS